MPNLDQSLLQEGDILLLDVNWVNAQPADSQWRIVGDLIALGESFLKSNPQAVHAAIVAGPGGNVLEELRSGMTRAAEILDERWIVLRPAYKDTAQASSVVNDCALELGTPYNYSEIAVLGIERLTGLAIPVSSHSFICSVVIASKLRKNGLDFWAGMRTEEIAPCDYLDRAGLKEVARSGEWLVAA